MNLRNASITLLLLLSIALLFSSVANANILINEFLANGGTTNDPETEWIEIYNNGTNSVQLESYNISDLVANFSIPNISIGGKGFIVLVGDSGVFNDTYSNHANITQVEHSAFELNNGGDTITLYNGSAVADNITYTSSSANVSIGRFPDGSTNIVTLSNLTPGSANDNEAPSITIVSPVANLNTTSSISVNATITDNHAVQAVNMTVMNGTGVVLALNPAVSGSEFNATINSSLLADGRYNLSITANDSTGNTAALNSTFTLDRVAPSIFVVQPDNVSFVQDWTDQVIANVTDETSGAFASTISYRYRTSNVFVFLDLNSIATTGNGAGGFTVSGSTNDYSTIEAQSNVTLTLEDHAGNSQSISWTYTVDQTAPAVNSIVTNESDNVVKPADSLNILVNITDLSAGAASANISGGNNIALTITSDTGWEANTTATALGCGNDADCILNVTAVDNAGNINGSESLTLTVDNTDPVIESFTTNDSKVLPSQGILLNLTINETNTASSAAITFANGSSVAASKTSTDGDLTSWTAATTSAALGCPGTDAGCTIRASATDDAGNTAASTLTLTVDDAAPSVNSITRNVSGNVNNVTVLEITANITDSNTITNVTLNGTPLSQNGDLWSTTNRTGDLCPGTLDSTCVLGVTATDELGNTNSSETISITINTFSPIVSGIPDVTFIEDGHNASLNLSEYVTDEDTDLADLTWSAFANTNITVSINQTTKIVNFTADPDFNGAQSGIVFLASDGVNSDSDTITITVSAVNDAPTAPTLGAPANNSNPATDSVTLDWSASSDVDGDSLSYHVAFGTNSPPGFIAQVSDTNLTITNLSKGTTYFWRVTADDGQTNSTNSSLFQFTSVVNNAPVNNATIPDVTLTEDTTDTSLDLDAYFSDADGDNLTFNASSVQDITLSINQSTGIVTITPAANFSGSGATVFTASDGTDTNTSNSITIIVTAAEDAPSIDSFSPANDPTIASQTGSQAFTASFSDVDDSSVFDAAWTRNGTSIGGNVTSVTVSNLQTGSYNITLIVSDNSSLLARQAWTLTASANLNSSAYSSNVLSLNESARQAVNDAVVNDSSFGGLDFTGSILNFSGISSLEQAFNISNNMVSVDTDTFPGLNGSAFVVMKGLNFTKAPLLFTASGFESTAGATSCSLSLCSNRSYDATNGILRFRAEHFTTFFAQTNTTNGAPVITSSPDTTATVGATYRYDVDASDPDGDTVTFSLTENPSGMSISSSSGQITWRPTSSQIGTHNVTVEATDGSLSDTQNFTVRASEGAKLVIEDVEVEVGDKRDSSVSNNSEISREAKPGDELVFEVEVANAFTDEEDLEIEDVEISITIEDIDDGDDLDEDSDRFDLDQGDSDSEDIKFTVPLLVDEDEYDVEIVVEGEDENGTEHRIFYNIILEVEKEDHELRLLQADAYPRIIACETFTTLEARVINTGQEDEDDAVLEITSDRLDILQGRFEFALEEGDDDDTIYERDVRIDIPENLPVGQYPVRVETFYDGATLSDSEQVMIEKVRCAQREEAQDTPDTLTPGQGDNQQQDTTPPVQQQTQQQPVQQDQSFRESNAYILLMTTMLITLTMLLFIGVAGLIIKLR